MVSRLAAEPRLPDDPEWPGRRDLEPGWRMPEAYLSAQFKYGSVFYGQMDRNWGRSGSRASGSATTATTRPSSALDIGVDAVRLLASPARSRTPTAPASGSTATSSPTGWASG